MNSRMKRISAALAFAVAGITTSAMAQEVAKQNQAVELFGDEYEHLCQHLMIFLIVAACTDLETR